MKMSCSGEEFPSKPSGGRLQKKPSIQGSTGRNDAKDELGASSRRSPERMDTGSSCVSAKSDQSKADGHNFSAERRALTEKSLRRVDTESSCVSAKSDQSKVDGPHFSAERKALTAKSSGSVDTGFSFVSMKSDRSKEENPYFSAEQRALTANNRKMSDDACGEEVLSSNAAWQYDHEDTIYSGSEHPFCQQFSISMKTFEEILKEHRTHVGKVHEQVTEGSEEAGTKRFFNDIYAELHITEGLREEVNTQHEVRQLETTSRINKLRDTSVRNHDIFKALPDQHEAIRVVLTCGVAGVGKTFSVQKFTLDWARGFENQDIHAVTPLSFRELNLVRDEQHSLLSLIQNFHPSFQRLSAQQLAFCRLLFIFDGLDESRLSLDFSCSQTLTDVTQKSSVSVVLTSLIQGHLLPKALIWITSRPAAANQIPSPCVSRLTEILGFTDPQKEEYFRKRFADTKLFSRIFSHIKSSRSLHIMCEVPIFCWISAVVLENMLSTEQGAELPTTLTDMYSHFIMVQTNRKKKYKGGDTDELTEADREVLLKLGRLAFEHLEKGNIMFYLEDLEQCGLDVTEASVYSGVFTQICRRECEIFQKPVYCFVHLTVQEFLAAVYMIHCYTCKNVHVVKQVLGGDSKADDEDGDTFECLNISSLQKFLVKIMEKSFHSKTGHMDLFVRFLHGLSVISNQKVFPVPLCQTVISQRMIKKMIKNLKERNVSNIYPDRSINAFYCLVEMKDLSVSQEIQEFLRSGNKSGKKLSEIQCSALAHMLQMSDQVLDNVDLRRYNTTEAGRLRLIPAVRNCKKFCFTGPELPETHCEVIASALKSNQSCLLELDLSKTKLQDSAVEALSAGLRSPNCILKTLRLQNCSLTEVSCATLASALKSNPSNLTELDLSENHDLLDSGMKQLCDFVKSPDCRLESLRLKDCSLSDFSWAALGSALENNPFSLKELDLSRNHIQKVTTLKHLCGFLGNPDSRLKTLRFEDCSLTKDSCAALTSALKSNPSHLTELDLGHNQKLQDPGVEDLCGFLKSSACKLEILRLKICCITERSFQALGSALESNPSHLTVLELSCNLNQEGSGVGHLCGFLKSPDCRLKTLRLRDCGISEATCGTLASALKVNLSHLTLLDLSENQMLQDSGVKPLGDFLKSPNCRLKTLRLLNCSLTKVSCDALGSALESNPSHLTELNLNWNRRLKDSGVKSLCGFLRSSECALKTLRLEDCGLTEDSCTALVSALKYSPSHLADLDLSENHDLLDSGVEHLCELVKSRDCRLKTLRLRKCTLTAFSCVSLNCALQSNPFHMTELNLEGNYIKECDVQRLYDLVENPNNKLEIVRW